MRIHHYASVTEILATAAQPFTRPANTDARSNYLTSKRGADWWGVSNCDEVKNVVAAGWPDGAVLVDDAFDSVAEKIPPAISFRRKLRRSNQGDEFDIHHALQGNLSRAWTSRRRQPNLGSGIVRIVVDVCGNSGTGSDELKWRGVAALALSRTMASAGYSVEIVAAAASAGSVRTSRTDCIAVVVKARHERPSTPQLAALTCLSGVFRSYIFAAWTAAADAEGVDVISGLGQAVELESTYPADPRIATVVTSAKIKDRDSALAWILQSHTLLQQSTIQAEK